MTASILAGLVGAALVGLGLYGLVVHPHPLRKLLAFNLIGSGVFLVFGIIARRGAAAGFPYDPVSPPARSRSRSFGAFTPKPVMSR
jgi:multicomponent Na+:H+ antiporter subunit C